MWPLLVSLARTKIGRVVIGVAIIGFFTLGFRIWLPIHDASVARAAREGYVLEQEKLTAEKALEEIARQKQAAESARDEYLQRLEASQKSEREAKATLEQEISSYELQLSEKNRLCIADRADVDWLSKH